MVVRELGLGDRGIVAPLEPCRLGSGDRHGGDPLELVSWLGEGHGLVQRPPHVGVATTRSHQPERNEGVDARERAFLPEADERGSRRLGPTALRQRDLRLPAEQVVPPDVEIARAAVVEARARVRRRGRPLAAPAGGPHDDRVALRHEVLEARVAGQLERGGELVEPARRAREELDPTDHLQSQEATGQRGRAVRQHPRRASPTPSPRLGPPPRAAPRSSSRTRRRARGRGGRRGRRPRAAPWPAPPAGCPPATGAVPRRPAPGLGRGGRPAPRSSAAPAPAQRQPARTGPSGTAQRPDR